jgi:GNAT superfamily N-acetyltransferase
MVRPATYLDCGAVREVVLSSIDATGDTYSSEQMKAWRDALSSRDFATIIESGSSFVALEDDAVIGFANLISREEKDGEIDLLYVSAKFRRMGAGTALVSLVEEHARALSILQIGVDASLLASPLLESVGYQVVERYNKSVGDVTFEDTRLSKTLSDHSASTSNQ